MNLYKYNSKICGITVASKYEGKIGSSENTEKHKNKK